MYLSPNFPSKKAAREAIAAGKLVTVFQPNNMFGTVPPLNGTVTIEGPHYPKPHKFYGTATLKDGKVIALK